MTQSLRGKAARLGARQRAALYEATEATIMERLRGRPGPVSAKALAREIGCGWRIVARALCRMAGRGEVKRKEGVEVRRYSCGKTFEVACYAIETNGVDLADLPAWLRGAVARQWEDGK